MVLADVTSTDFVVWRVGGGVFGTGLLVVVVCGLRVVVVLSGRVVVGAGGGACLCFGVIFGLRGLAVGCCWKNVFDCCFFPCLFLLTSFCFLGLGVAGCTVFLDTSSPLSLNLEERRLTSG